MLLQYPLEKYWTKTAVQHRVHFTTGPINGAMAMAPSGAADSYDHFPYVDQPYPQSHPDRLAVVATLFGLNPARVDRCRVLELGCASGGNIIPMAVALPDSVFVGIEQSQRQAAAARACISGCGLANVEVRTADILDLDGSLGEFDYIISHGVYSWVPQPVRDRIMDIYRRCLKPHGVGYISYNTLPGWHMRGMIRDMMCFHAGRLPGQPPQAQLDRARDLIRFLADTVQGENDPYVLLLKKELSLLEGKPDAYLYHEQMETHNDAFYFHQFCRHLNEHGLAYLGEVNVNSMGVFGYSDKVRKVLADFAGSQVDMEQYLDFLVNRTFRQTLVCREHLKPSYAVSPEVVTRLHIAAAIRPQTTPVDLGPGAAVTFTSPDGSKLDTHEPIVKAAACCLLQAWPGALSFASLVSQARALLGSAVPADSDQVRAETAGLGKLILQAYLGGGTKLFELWQCAPRFAVNVSDRPAASPCARWQAPRQDRVTNLRHEFQTLSPFTRKLLPLVDGTRSHQAVVDALADAHGRGELSLDLRGQPVTDKARARELLAQALQRELTTLARSALLVA